MIADLAGALAALLADPRVLAALAVVFVAGLVRGFSGFGTGLIYVPIAAALFGPQVAAATVLLYDLPAVLPQTLRLLPKADVRAVLPLSIGAMAATPVGVWALATVDPLAVRWIISLGVLGGLAAIASGWRRTGRAGDLASVAVGGASGFLNGIAQIGGPPVILFWLSGATAAATIRASLSLYFVLGSAVTIVSFSIAGLITGQALLLALLMAPVFALALWIGHNAFDRASEATYRRIAYGVILASGLAGLPLWR